ncbi:hypothetical protein GCM10027449_10090 [Sinomonas notoginsengisoli]|uniref:hypothetical protein n=1 Tax=Sinomonas notoginsengisoli TaxID=1457311 RepID=UPI001F2881B6|nr:hypothetical protein [Sinomonas notoginsengisoli]
MSASTHTISWFHAPSDGVAAHPRQAFRVRRIAGAACLPLLFLEMIVGSLVVPLAESATSPQTLAFAADHPAALSALAWMELLGAAICIGGLLTLVGAIRARGAWLANVLGILAVPFGVGMAAISLNHFVALGLTRSGIPATDAAAALDGFHAAGGPLPILFMLGPVIFLLVALAAWRARLVPAAAIALGVLFAALAAVPGPQWTGMAAYAVGFVLTAWVAWAEVSEQRPLHTAAESA